MDPETGEILDTFGPEIGVDVPDDLISGPDGSLYWTALLLGEVGRLAPDGTVTTQFVAPGVNPITFSDDGRLFTSQCYAGETVFEISPELDVLPREVISFPGTSCGLNGMDWGPDGHLYGPRQLVGDVVRVDVNRGTFEVAASGFAGPGAVKFDHQERLHVLDAHRGEIVRFDRNSGEPIIIARLTEGLDNLAFNSEGRLFVSSFSDNFIVELVEEDDCAGEGLCGKFRTVSPGGLGVAGGIAVADEPRQPESIIVYDSSVQGVVGQRAGRHSLAAWFTSRLSADGELGRRPSGALIVGRRCRSGVGSRRQGGDRGARFRSGDQCHSFSGRPDRCRLCQWQRHPHSRERSVDTSGFGRRTGGAGRACRLTG